MTRASAPSYDLFKLIVTVILVVILVLMLMRGCSTTTAAPAPVEEDTASQPAAGIVSPVATTALPAAETMESPTPSLGPSASPTTAATSTPESELPTPTTAPVTETPVSTATEPATPNATATTITSSDTTSCNTSVPSRLSVGQEAQIVQRLNMRSAAAITAPILQTNPTNTRVEIIGGPVCTPAGERAYLWWQIRLANGTEGWSAESSLSDAIYLLEPIP